jgi:T5SS/PEP-CTERM-associated repeat protein
MNKILAAALSFAFGFSVAITSSLRADDFIRLQPGDFSSPNWYNSTTGQGPNAGPPGANDNAFLGGESVTSSGTSVLSVGNGTLTLTGGFNAPTISGGLTLSGGGTLTAQTGSANVNGGHLMIQNYTASSVIIISNSGSIVAGTIPDSSSAVVSSGGSLTINSTVNDVNLTLESGATFRAPNVNNGQSVSVTIDGGGSALTVDQQFGVEAGFLDISNGGALTVNGQLSLDGGNGGGGGGHWQGANTTIISNGAMFLGSTTGSFSLGIDNGATVETASVTIGRQQGSTGNVNLSGAGTLWHVQAIGLTVGRTGTGKFDISNNAHLLLDPGTVFAIGFDSGSHGNMTLDGNGSVIDATGALVSLGKSGGSVGGLVLTNQASLLLGQNTFIGDGGSGTLSVSSGSHVTLSGDLTRFGVGNQAGSAGSISVQGTDSSLTVAGPMIVGVGGNGFLGVSQGGKIALTNNLGLKLGELSGAHGTLVVDGAQTSLDIANFLALGDGGIGQATISGGGEINVTGSKVDVGGPAGSTGSITITGQDSFLSVETVFGMTVGGAGTGSVIVADDAQVLVNQVLNIAVRNGSTGSLSISDAGTLLYASSILFGDLPIPNHSVDGGAGTITVQNGGRLRVQNSIDIRSSTANPSVTITNGQIGLGTGDFGPPGSLRVSENGVLIGNPNAIRGQVIIGLGGRISPGNSPGIIAIDGGYQQDAGSTFLAEIGGADPGTGYDQITATGTASFGGNLTVRLVNGFTPTVGQTFRIVNAASASGAFDSISEPSQAGISLTSDATGVTVTITSVVAGAPVISSATTASAAPGAPFSYQIAATNNPTTFGATNLPAGLTVSNSTGLISGTLANPGVFIVPINANNTAGSGQADLTLIVAPVSSVPALPPSNLLNISTRLQVQTGENVLIGGFIITGTAPKKVIIRGIGPSLGATGVPDALADPTLELHQGSTTLMVNDNWRTDQEAEIIATGVPPINDLESAIVSTLDPGPYTAILVGKNNGTGIGLIEAYDLDQAASSKLANISTRGFVNTGDNAMIGGFIIGGNGGGGGRVVVRAIGPSLGAVGISNALQDPFLELHDANGSTLMTNDNWRSSQQAEIEATGLALTNDLESALVTTLQDGNYTAIVRGNGDTTGVATVEVYNIL